MVESVAGSSIPSVSRIVGNGEHVELRDVGGREVLVSLRCWQL